jgi:hypothetical protein
MKKTDRIQRYLDGSMDEDELKEFRDELQADPEFVQELDLHRSGAMEPVSANEDDYRNDNAYFNPIQRLKSQEKQTSFLFRAMKIRYLGYTGLLVVLISAFAFIDEYTKESNDAIFNRYFLSVSDETENLFNGLAVIPEGALKDAIRLYRESDYPAAERMLGKIVETDPGNACARLYLGLSRIYLNDFSGAISEFSRITSQSDEPFTEYAGWYLALCLIKTDNPLYAGEKLEEIAHGKGTFSHRSTKVLRKLRMNP